ncbi:MAG: cell division protein FtsZ [Sandaracinus sp.]|nr:cell division protein FtsZ [Sandaracinus sp.]|tara:strand:+ start:278 stop:1528 length:1251 start_codon:yes stop_codon:yes gene_type:complete
MTISIELMEDNALGARIKVVGVGGSGGNALNTMISSGLEGVEFIAANTDAQALEGNLAPTRIQLGPTLTKGLGAGGSPDVGRKAALEDVQRIAESLAGADMVFVTAGMGGGTGTGAAPIIAQVARDQGALTVGVVTKPFLFEGRRRSKNADHGIQELEDSVDSIITIPNQKLLCLGNEDMSMLDAFERADDVLLQAVQGISDLITTHGMINVDFADVRTIMSAQGRALMGTGFAKGDTRAEEAASMAINSPLLDDITVDGARGILINFTAGPDLKLSEIDRAASLVQQAAHEEAEIIFGLVTDPDMHDLVKVTVIATGFDSAPGEVQVERPARAQLPIGGLREKARTAIGGRTSRPPAYSTPPPSKSDIRAVARAAATAQNEAVRPSRAFGASALHDEAVLDIPAYLRRSGAASQE